jgi:excisionase family DNA binding protein
MKEFFEEQKPAMLTISAACRYAGIARSRLYLEIKTGRVDARKAGRRTLITRESLDAFLASLPRVEAQ